MAPLEKPASAATRVSAIWSTPTVRTARAALSATFKSVCRDFSDCRAASAIRGLSHTNSGYLQAG